MLPAAVFPVSPGDRVLDLCAAPGGKATALAAKLQGQGVLVANEISASRAKALLKNLEVSGVTNSFVTNTTANRLAEQFPEAFDRILVDAPCSGEGMFRKDIANAKAWSMDKVRTCAKLQRDILRQAVTMLRPGGLLLYSTCTFAPEEDEGTAAYLLSRYPELELLAIPGCEMFSEGRPEYLQMTGEGKAGDPGAVFPTTGTEETADLSALSRCVRIFPHRNEGEGHFLALFRKKGVGEPGRKEMTGQNETTGRKGMIGQKKMTGRKEMTGQNETTGRKRMTGRKNLPVQMAGGTGRDDRTALEAFLEDVSAGWDTGRIEMRSGQVYYVPNEFSVGSGLPFLRNGLYLGEVRRGRFEPSQSFAMALGPGAYASVINFAQGDARIRRYLCGETVQADDMAPNRSNGWQLVSICGYPLGWGKLVNGTLKNKYHPGWRMQN